MECFRRVNSGGEGRARGQRSWEIPGPRGGTLPKSPLTPCLPPPPPPRRAALAPAVHPPDNTPMHSPFDGVHQSLINSWTTSRRRRRVRGRDPGSPPSPAAGSRTRWSRPPDLVRLPGRELDVLYPSTASTRFRGPVEDHELEPRVAAPLHREQRALHLLLGPPLGRPVEVVPATSVGASRRGLAPRPLRTLVSAFSGFDSGLRRPAEGRTEVLKRRDCSSADPGRAFRT